MSTTQAVGSMPSAPLREIAPVRQDASGRKRWFQDEYFDLFLWQDEGGAPFAFQLCYARSSGAEGAISWSEAEGFAHASVDTGGLRARYAETPLLRPDGTPPYFRIYRRFLAAASDWDPLLRAFMLERLREYRRELYGVPRKPRRRRG